MDLILIIFIIAIALAIVALFGLLLIESFRDRSKLTRALNMTLFLVRLPRESRADDKRTDKEYIAVMEQFFASFGQFVEKSAKAILGGQPHLVFEIAVHHIGEEIHFYVACPRRYEEILERGIQGFYPHASVERVRDYNIFVPHGVEAASVLTLAKRHLFPLRTYATLESDPMANITNALSKLEREGEGAAIQILVRPVQQGWGRVALRTAKLMQQGKSYERAVSEAEGGMGALYHDLVTPTKRSAKEKTEEKSMALTPMAQETIKAIESKAAKAGFQTIIRLVTSAASEARATRLLEQLENSFTQFSHPSWNSFKSRRAKGRALRQLLYNFSFRHFADNEALALNTEELASIFHFPIPRMETPRVLWLKSKAAPPPENLPQEAEGDSVMLGESRYRGESRPVRILRDDRRRHLYIMGQTGTGKSTMLFNMIRQDIERGEGVGVVDPHGELVEDVLGIIPPSRAEDVVLFDPGDMERPMGLNMLEAKSPEQKDFAVQEMIAIFYKLFPPEVIGPMFEHNMRNAMLTLMADEKNPGTIVEVPRIFTDEKFVRALLPKVTDPVVRAFWEKEMAKTTEFHKSEMLGYLISKVGRFVENEMMRNIIGQPRSGFDVREIMDKKKILLANLSKGRVGEVNSSLLGMILVSKLQMAAMSRGDIRPEARTDFYLYIDEFQNFTTDSIATILSEARKYRLNLIMAHQFIAQLPDKIKDAAFGNVGSLVSFRVGADDGEYLAHQFEPVFSQQDLLQLDNFNAYAKLMLRNETSRPFNFTIFPPRPGKLELAAHIKELSRLKFGRPRQIVEKEILERSQLGGLSEPKPSFIPGEINK